MDGDASQLVQDKKIGFGRQMARRARPIPPRIKVIAAVALGTSGAKSPLNNGAEAAVPPHRRAWRGLTAGFLAAQLRRLAVETPRALLLLPPSLVRSGVLRSDIYPWAPVPARRAEAFR